MQKDNRLLLEAAFESFRRTSLELERYYRSLQERVRELTLELERSHRQREEMAELLQGVLESLSAAVLVVRDGKALPLNRAAEEILGLEPSKQIDVRALPFLPAEKETTRAFRGRQLRVTSVPLQGGGGEVVVVEDVTELEKWRKQALRGEGLNAMQEVAAQLAHQVRNPLGVVKLFASLLQRELRDDPRGEMAEHVLRGVEEMERVVSKILLFIRPQQPDLKPMDLKEPLEEVLSFVRRLLRENGIALRSSIPTDPLPVTGDGELLKQVFYNLLLNAVEAMPGGGTLRVEASRNPSRLKGEMAEVTVADTGCGIPAEALTEVFKPFFTTKKGGTGIGLTVAHRIVEAHKGLIEVESRLEEGTTFRVLIPLRSGGEHEGT